MGYAGGKAGPGVFHRIISLMPPHRVYIEPFMGGFSIGRLKRPAVLNIGMDRDRTAVEKAMPPDGSRDSAVGYRSAGTPEPRRQSSILTPLPDPLSRTIDGTAARWIFNEGDGIEFLQFVSTWWTRLFQLEGPVLIYCDPPYMRHTCASRCRYRYDLADVDHRRLLRVLQDLNRLEPHPLLMISGYDSELYREMLPATGPNWQGWEHVTFQAMTRGGKQATEHLWFNFAPPTVLHDYRYTGTNWRDRERIKRVQQSAKRKILRMKPYERQAWLNAIAETGADAVDSNGSRASDVVQPHCQCFQPHIGIFQKI